MEFWNAPLKTKGVRNMFKRLIDSLTLHYTYMAKSRGVMSDEERAAIADASAAMVKYAPRTMVPMNAEVTEDDKIDLKECGLIVDHIQQMAEWIEQLRITEIM